MLPRTKSCVMATSYTEILEVKNVYSYTIPSFSDTCIHAYEYHYKGRAPKQELGIASSILSLFMYITMTGANVTISSVRFEEQSRHVPEFRHRHSYFTSLLFATPIPTPTFEIFTASSLMPSLYILFAN